jgi:phenylalanyl-tRNA synthetase beta chain
MLVIADEKQAVALAGVMGGSASDVHDGTTDIILEAANFDATTVRKAALASGIRTDSSTRFEKTIDPEWTMLAIQRAVALIKEVCPEARVTSNVADWYEQMPEKKSVAVAHAFIEQKIGVSFSASYIVETLTRLGFEVTESEGQYHIQIPTWRATKDVAIKEDIVEEIARMYGFNQVPVALPSFPIQPAVRNPLREWCDAALDVLTQEEGFNEVYQYSFVSPETLAKLDIDDSDHIELDHPIAKDRPLVRKSLIPNLLETTERNQHRFDVVALLEVGKTFINDQQGPDGNPDGTWKLPTQREQLGLVFMEKGNDTPFFALAQAVEALNVHGLTAATLIAAEPIEPWMHPTRTAHVCVGDVVLGYIAELHPTHQRAMAIDHRVAVMQLDIPKLAECKPNTDDRYTPLSAFPSVDRDVALVVDRGVVHTDLHKVILDAHDLVVSAELFDVYMGEHMPADKKSMAYHVTLQSPKETLQAAQIDEAFDAVLKALAATGAELRTK